MSTEQRDKAALEEYPPCSLVFDESNRAAFRAGWDAHAATMPDREAVAKAIASGLDGWNDFDAASEDYKNELLSGADAVLALLNKEGEE